MLSLAKKTANNHRPLRTILIIQVLYTVRLFKKSNQRVSISIIIDVLG